MFLNPNKYIKMPNTETQKRHFTDEQLKNIKRTTLAKKHNVTPEYVGQIIRGEKEANSDVAKAILIDAKKIVELIESI